MTRADARRYHYIYKITRFDGKYYIGMHSTDDLEDGYFGSGKKITRSIKKYGVEKHSKEILEFLDSRESLRNRERELVNEEILDDPKCMNLALGGDGGWYHITDEARRRGGETNSKTIARKLATDLAFRESLKIWAAKVLANKIERGTKRGPSKPTWTGKKHSEETKQKMRKSKNVGEANSQFGTCWVTNGQPIKIKKEQLDEYLTLGYRRGRK